LERRTIHLEDLAVVSVDEYPEGRALQQRWGPRSVVATPLREPAGHRTQILLML
jgi:hypothetical protein